MDVSLEVCHFVLVGLGARCVCGYRFVWMDTGVSVVLSVMVSAMVSAMLSVMVSVVVSVRVRVVVTARYLGSQDYRDVFNPNSVAIEGR